MEYVKKAVTSSGVAKAALALGITGTGLNVLNNGGVGNLFGGGLNAPSVAVQNNFVSEKEMALIRESSGKDAVIAQLTAEKYADNAIRVYAQTEVEPLKARVCALETKAEVDKNDDKWTWRYMNSEFIHQPKASIKESIVVCKQCGCEPRDCCC